jgi:hypothetical protein
MIRRLEEFVPELSWNNPKAEGGAEFVPDGSTTVPAWGHSWRSPI